MTSRRPPELPDPAGTDSIHGPAPRRHQKPATPSPPPQPPAPTLPLRTVRALGIPDLLAAKQIDAPMFCQGPLGSGSARRLVICSARCSALVRDRPMVVMTLWWPRRSRMSQVRPGGCPRVLEEPVSIWTVMGGMAGPFPGSGAGEGVVAGAAGVADKTGMGRSGGAASSY